MGEIAAEQADQFANGKIGECRRAARFEVCRQAPAEITLDLRPPERPHVINPSAAAVDASEKPALLLEFLGLCER